ncbi:phosphoethanolamine transferase PIGF [Histoplasma capsulatum G186AR]|uniref:Phosphoethanolamine transferase PIGF n=2 Tax=Ajellomyces capsulatus TaxID=5037 RepID=C0NLJ2_AJECG|nr:phosphoethanolamine transferase PIGF [Histoplasma capsulatum G186AR]EEH07493.1 phosphoethanolamine transferase PIGF [Histoplasma capsulatum G186AR]KAG5304361.1 phosphoethanolamine transferase PIGF [Histoplasma capsulatum]QSS69959.1 phosphoethanolamine transferase PIGF [Histoplasma capsulatum G186AR]
MVQPTSSPKPAPAPPSQHSPVPSSQPQPHPPTSILSSPLAQTYAHIHPLLLLSLFALRFRALVDDPVSALLGSLAPLALMQGVYVIVCLPATTGGGSGDSGLGKGRSGGGGGGGGGSAAPGVSGKIGARKRIGGAKVIPALLSVTLPLILGTPLFAICLILFGAPFTTDLPATTLCAAHMSILAGTSLIYVHGTDGAVWREIWGISRAIDAVWGATVGVGLGAWFGAVPIPLDWDRPWQTYPITIVTGAYIGYALGYMAGRTPLLYGKRIQFTESEEEEEEEEECVVDGNGG